MDPTVASSSLPESDCNETVNFHDDSAGIRCAAGAWAHLQGQKRPSVRCAAGAWAHKQCSSLAPSRQRQRGREGTWSWGRAGGKGAEDSSGGGTSCAHQRDHQRRLPRAACRSRTRGRIAALTAMAGGCRQYCYDKALRCFWPLTVRCPVLGLRLGHTRAVPARPTLAGFCLPSFCTLSCSVDDTCLERGCLLASGSESLRFYDDSTT